MASLRRPDDCHRETIRFVTARIILTPRRDVDLPDRDPPHRVVLSERPQVAPNRDAIFAVGDRRPLRNGPISSPLFAVLTRG
jgi:hypothetical protein